LTTRILIEKGFYDAQSSEQSDGKPKRGRKEEKEL
jgi:hypothetical protein